jgi:murein L,D-transpeptidase YafK
MKNRFRFVASAKIGRPKSTMKRAPLSAALCVLSVALVVVSSSLAATNRSNLTADRVVISKSKGTLTLFRDGEPIKTYRVTFGKADPGPKTCDGDNKTPEGHYLIDCRNKTSKYHFALHISYPNEQDIDRAREARCSPGGDIMIHGIKNGFGWPGPLHRVMKWTRGCIAVTNPEIDEIAQAVPDNTPVLINP